MEIGPVRPVAASESPDGVAGWLVTRHDDVLAALSEPRLSNQKVDVSGCPRTRVEKAAVYGASAAVAQSMTQTMVTTDPPEHTRLRKLVVRDFSAKRIETFRPRVQQIADELLDAIADRDEVDLVRTFAFPLPIRMTIEVLDVPADLGQRLLLPDEEYAGPKIPMDLLHAVSIEWVERRLREPADDVVTQLIAAHERGEMSYEELVAMPLLLMLGAHISTTQLLGNGVVLLLRHPEQRAELLRDPSLMPAAVDEVLRYAGPVAMVGRYAHEDVEIGGTTIPAGSVVRVMLDAATRDPGKFADPDSFDIHRADGQHRVDGNQLPFGHGIHYCLGARLAKLEGEVGIPTIFRRFPDLSLVAPVTLTELDDGILGLESLPVRLRARQAAGRISENAMGRDSSDRITSVR